jgi:hypothetical protein
VLAHRTNPTTRQLGSLLGISDFAARRVIDRLAPHLAASLGPPPADRRERWIVDGTLIPAHDQSRTASSRNDRRGVHTRIVYRARDRRIVAAGRAWPKNRNDTLVFRATLGQTPPDHPRLNGDGGHCGNSRVTSPRRGPDGRIVRDWNHRRFRERRATAEHTIARPTDHRILRQCHRGEAIDHAIAGVAALHNLTLETA